MKLLLPVLVIFITSLGIADAKIYYVSTSGVNTNSGLTGGLSWKTLTYAAGSSSPVVAGDTVYVQSGSYGAEKVVFAKSGTAVKPISYIGYKNFPGDAPPLIVNNADPYADFNVADMPTYDGGDRTSAIGFDCSKQKYLIIKNFQIKNYAYAFMAGSATQTGNLILYNINAMSIGDFNASYSGLGFIFGSMGTSFSNNNILTNCTVVNSCAEGIGINGDNNQLTGCKVYCNENTNYAATDYYIIVTGSYNTLSNCYIERAPGLSHAGHGISLKSNAEQVVDQGLSLPVISPQYNKVLYCVAKNMGESFCVRHRGTQNNLFYHCKAIGTHTGAIGSSEGEGNCMVTRDGASNNTFDGCIAENCAAGFVFEDTVEDGDTGTNPTGHPGNNNKYINCLIYNCYYGVQFSNYSLQSDAGDNTIANCTFYKVRYLHYAARHCANMKYIGNIYYGCLPTASGGYFSGSTFASDIMPNGTNTYFKNCDFINIEGGLPSNFAANSPGSITTDPLLNNPSGLDFHLKSTSPCKDACTIINTVTDFDSLSRPVGAAVDIGAYEYQITSLLSATISSSNVNCNGGNNGSATVVASGGKTPYTYLWNNGQTNAISSGLSAGNYSVTVTDASSSSKTILVSISQPSVLTLTFSAQTNVKCSGGNDGSATVTVSGGKSPYTYSWSNSQSGAAVASLKAGTYSVTVYDANGCSKSSTVSITEPSSILVSIGTQTNVKCSGGNDGSATVTVSGGKSPYTYSWSNSQSGAAVASLKAGTYSVTVYDANGCSKSSTVSITEPSSILVSIGTQTNVKCSGGNDGSATVTVSGGKSPYTYSWSNGQSGATAASLKAGTYSVTVYDANTCSRSSVLNIIEPLSIIATASTISNVSSNGGNDGSTTVTVSGGKSPYTYSWSNGQVVATATGLKAGSYFVTVYDANGCSKSSTASISEPSSILVSIGTQTNVKCSGGNDGSATATVSGGKSPYTYLWSNGQTNIVSSGLSAGNYYVTVTDANSTSKTVTVTITEPSIIAINSSQTNVSSNGGNNGVATVTVNGGKSPYTYSWSNGQVAATATGLKAGSYSVTVYDGNGCSKVSVVTITEPSSLVVTSSQTDVKCNRGNDGSATVTAVSGGKAPYTYLWSTGQTNSVSSGLSAGSYSVTVADANNISTTISITIIEPSAIVVSVASQANVRCKGESSGNVTVSVSGGMIPYTYSWSNGQTSASATGLKAGSYIVTVFDRNTCLKTHTVIITEPAQLTVSNSSEKDVSCNGGNNGNAEVIASGGDGDFSYLWVPSGQTNAAAQGLIASDHTVTVSDRHGCNTHKVVTISQPDPIVVANLTVVNPTSCSSNDGSVRISASGGSGRCSHYWNTSPPQTSELASGLYSGQYSDIISDINGCSIVATATVVCTNPTSVIDQSKQENELDVFPNPSAGPFSISTPVKQVGKPILVVVRDLLGNEYYSKVIVVSNSQEIFTIDPSGSLSPGVYLVIATSDDKLYEKKIVVK